MGTNTSVTPARSTTATARTSSATVAGSSVCDSQTKQSRHRKVSDDVTCSVQRRSAALQDLSLDEVLSLISGWWEDDEDHASLSAPLIVIANITQDAQQDKI